MVYLTDDEVRIKLYEKNYDVVIFNYTPMTCSIADRVFRESKTHEQKDIRSVAMLALVEGVHQIKSDRDKPGMFLRMKIKGAVINFVMRDHMIHCPYGNKLSWREQYAEDVVGGDSLTGQGGYSNIPKEMWAPFDSQECLTVENLLLGTKYLSDLEKDIIKMRIDGETLQEIAKKCRMPFSQVQRILTATKSRVVKILDGVI